MKKTIFLLAALLIATLVQAQTSVTVNVTTAGTLSTLLTQQSTVTNLTVTGSIDSLDFVTMNGCSSLQVLDLSGANCTRIPVKAFDNKHSLTTIKLPASLTSIGSYAFCDCYGLTSIKIPASLTSIGNAAFDDCYFLTAINLPASLTSISDSTFCYCEDLTSITLPASLTSIGSYAFCDCEGLTSITLPASLTSIGNAAFYHCEDLTSITLPASLTSIGSYAFCKCTGLTAINIPASVTSIGSYAFTNLTTDPNLTDPTPTPIITNTVISITVNTNNTHYSSINGALFNKTQDTLLYVPENVTGFTIPSTVTAIGHYAFSGYQSTSITIPSTVTSIGVGAFESCSLKSIIIPSSVTLISDSTFYYCGYDGNMCNRGLTTITIPASVTSIGKSAFKGCCSLTAVNIPSSVTSIGANAFMYCFSLTTVSIPSSVTSIGSGAFNGCNSLTSINIPSSVTSIGDSTFNGCSRLTAVNIPASVTSIGSGAFGGCSGLTAIYAHPVTPINLASSPQVFYDINVSTCSLYVPVGSVASYSSAAQWQDFFNINEMTTLSVSNNAVGIEYKAGTDSVTVYSNTTWTASSNQTWLTVSPNTATTDTAKLTFTAKANPDTVARTATVTVQAAAAMPQTITITQAAGVPTLSVSADSVSLANNYYSSATLTVNANIPWTASSNQTWLNLNYYDYEGAKDTTTLTITATSANQNSIPRTAIVTVQAPGVASQTITVTQAAGTPALTVYENTASLAQQVNSTTSVSVYSNISWTAGSDQSWLQVVPNKITTDTAITTTLTFTAMATNPNSTDRIAIVTISAAGVASQTITVTQEAAQVAGSVLSLAASTASISSAANSMASVGVTSDTTWTAASNQSWLTVSPNTATTGNGTLTFTATANTTIETRSAIVTLYIHGVAMQTIMVTQVAGDTVLTVSANAATVSATANSTTTINVTSNTTWTATTTQTWLTVSPSVATSGNAFLTLTASANTGAGRTATVTIAAAGVASQTITVTQAPSSATQCSSLTITPATTAASCNGGSDGSVVLTVSGGTAPYIYKWSTTRSDNQIVAIPAGSYSVSVTDSLGCVASQSFTVTEPLPLALNPTLQTPSCNTSNGSISLAPTGGTSPYNFMWSNTVTTASLTSVSAGIYSVTITDANKCVQTQSITLSNGNAPVIAIDSVVATQCNVNAGSITVSVTGGTPSYTYHWNDNATSQNRTSVAPCSYGLSVTDKSGCVGAIAVVIPATAFQAPTISLVSVDSSTNKNEVVWLKDATSAIKYYTVYRESSSTDVYDSIGTVLYGSTSIYEDQIANPFVQAWRYKLSATDYCGNTMESASEFKTIFLQKVAGFQGSGVDLFWDSYEGTAYSSFDIYRLSKSAGTTLITTVSSDVNRYNDPTPPSDVQNYFVAIDLPNTIDPSKTKQDIGPFSQSLSNMAESQLTGVAKVVDNTVVLYPNPAHSSFSINTNTQEPAQVKVYAVSGTLVLSAKIKDKEPIATNGLPAGLYVVKIVTATGVVVRSLVVE